MSVSWVLVSSLLGLSARQTWKEKQQQERSQEGRGEKSSRDVLKHCNALQFCKHGEPADSLENGGVACFEKQAVREKSKK